jgi:hypothetical protein
MATVILALEHSVAPLPWLCRIQTMLLHPEKLVFPETLLPVPAKLIFELYFETMSWQSVLGGENQKERKRSDLHLLVH